MPTQRFYQRAKSSVTRDADLADFFAYHLTIELGNAVATVKQIRECYRICDMEAPSWLAAHLSKGLKKPRKFIKLDGGYRLESKRREEVASLLGTNDVDIQVSASLDQLETQIPAGPKRDFLHETIKCYGVRAYRAAVVMCWNLTIHHLQDYVLSDSARHVAFNAVLAKNMDARVKIKLVGKRDDFTEMPESKFLIFCREAKLISSTVFNKLESRLDERNGAAHPSGVKVTPRAAEAYIEDLVENVIKKFPTYN